MKSSQENGSNNVKTDIASFVCASLNEQATDMGLATPFSLSDILPMMEKPPERKLGDYAIPCFKFAGKLRQKPQDITTRCVIYHKDHANVWIDRIEAVGGFLNVFVKQTELAKHVIPRISSGEYFTAFKEAPDRISQRVMIEYSQPNTHKIFHVGHMRNVALGDTLWRLFDYCGYPVIPVNYIGDEGAHIAKCIWYIQKNRLTPPETDKGDWLGEMYAKATMTLEDASADQKREYETEISSVLRAIESKKGDTYEFWKQSKQWSLDVFNAIYDWIGARFDYVFTESEVSEQSQKIVDEYLERGVLVESEGAIGLDLKQEKLGFVLLRKKDGNTLYATKDLALAKLKFEKFAIQRAIYVVASEQQLHFRQVFKTLERMGFPQAKMCYHLSYGLVVLPGGKMSSRAGNIVPFSHLKDELQSELGQQLKKYEGDWSADEIYTTNHKLAVGAIRYGMLCSDPAKDIVFDIKNWLSFDGDTGPYLMYSYARTQSILRKAGDRGLMPQTEHLSLLVEDEEGEILSYLYGFNDIVEQALNTYKPSTLCHYLFEMCKSYNRFHIRIQVLRAASPELIGARLALLAAFCAVLRQGLGILGIVPPERM